MATSGRSLSMQGLAARIRGELCLYAGCARRVESGRDIPQHVSTFSQGVRLLRPAASFGVGQVEGSCGFQPSVRSWWRGGMAEC